MRANAGALCMRRTEKHRDFFKDGGTKRSRCLKRHGEKFQSLENPMELTSNDWK